MGEKIVEPNDSFENGYSGGEEPDNPDNPVEPENMDLDDENEVGDEGDLDPEEFATINNRLDEISSALDDIEEKNDNIYSRLLQLLQANREVRQELSSSKPSQEQDSSAKDQDQPN